MIQMITPIHRGHPDSGEHQLALAVLVQAIDDLKRNRLWSREWFHSSAFEFWAEVLGDYDADVLRQGILRRFDTGDGGTAIGAVASEKRQAVREALAETPDATLKEIARRCGCSPYLVGKVRSSMQREACEDSRLPGQLVLL